MHIGNLDQYRWSRGPGAWFEVGLAEGRKCWGMTPEAKRERRRHLAPRYEGKAIREAYHAGFLMGQIEEDE